MTYDIRFEGGPVGEAGQRRIVDLLLEQIPSIEIAEINYRMIAERRGTSEEIERKRAGVELSNDDDGVLVIVHGDGRASLSVTYGAVGEEAVALVGAVWRYLELFASGGYSVMDPQVAKTLDLAADFDRVVQAYERGTEMLRRSRARRE